VSFTSVALGYNYITISNS